MKVQRAEAAGACYGVERALDIARKAASEADDVKSLGPLIHNPQVVAELASKGVQVIDEVGDDLTGTIIIRSHGVGPGEMNALRAIGVDIADATCPFVLRAQKAAADLAKDVGYVVVVGDPHHPEVEAICAYAREAGGTVCVADAPEAVPEGLPVRIGVVVQTTQNRAVFEAVMRRIEEMGCSAIVKDTICSATAKRQGAAAELAQAVDAMVVIGGRNSSNTTRLYEICKALCPKTYHIEEVDELDAGDFEDCTSVGVTAGASTPETQIRPVVEYLERL